MKITTSIDRVTGKINVFDKNGNIVASFYNEKAFELFLSAIAKAEGRG